jgi:hypothetical protein
VSCTAPEHKTVIEGPTPPTALRPEQQFAQAFHSLAGSVNNSVHQGVFKVGAAFSAQALHTGPVAILGNMGLITDFGNPWKQKMSDFRIFLT